MENSQIEQPEPFENEPELDGDECPECGEPECGFCALCSKEECCCDCADEPEDDDEEFPDEDMRDEYDEESGI